MSHSTKKSRAYSATTKKSQNLPVHKKGRGLGYFGDDNDKIREF